MRQAASSRAREELFGLQGAMAAVHGEIVFIDVLDDHAMHVEFGVKANDGSLHAIDPFTG